ncbi:K(+)-transporting ATPase subunit F [Bacillus sp. 123MFChir2]
MVGSSCEGREEAMSIAVSIIVGLLTVYLVYALLNPEKF